MPNELESEQKKDQLEQKIRQKEIIKANTEIYHDTSDLGNIHDPISFAIALEIMKHNLDKFDLDRNDAIQVCKHLLINTINICTNSTLDEIQERELKNLI